jgi:hypothetical protein
MAKIILMQYGLPSWAVYALGLVDPSNDNYRGWNV